MGIKAIEEGYEVNVPEECPDNLEEAVEMLGNVKYAAWGFCIFFLHKDQGKLTEGWSATFRNTARFTNPSIKTKTPLEACKEMHAFLLKLKKQGKTI